MTWCLGMGLITLVDWWHANHKHGLAVDYEFSQQAQCLEWTDDMPGPSMLPLKIAVICCKAS